MPAAKRLAAPNHRTELKELAAQRALLLERRATLAACPRPLAEAEPDLDLMVKRAASEIAPALAGVAQSAAGWADAMHALRGVGRSDHHPSVVALLAAVAPDLVRTWLAKELAANYDGLPEPLPTAERAHRLAELDKDLAAVERRAAEIWWAAHAEGLGLPLPEVGPAALLGLDA